MSADKLSRTQLFYQTKNVFKRNRRYVDNDSMEKLKSMLEKQRRMPDSRSLSTRDRFDSSFRNSKHTFNEKLAKDIERFKGRMVMSRVDDPEDSSMKDPQTTRSSLAPDSSRSPKKIKGVPLNLVLSRKELIPESKDPLDERLFNNFKLEEPKTDRTADFSKRRGRHERTKSAIYQEPENQPDTSKKHQQFYYKETTMKCLFNYKVQKEQNEKIWMFRKRKQDVCDNDIDPERVKGGFECTNSYKPTSITHFYNNSGRELPSNLEMRNMKSNENPYLNTDGLIQRPVLEYSLRQQRQHLKDQRLMEIRKSKRPKLEKESVCMEVFFRRYKDEELQVADEN